MRKHYFLGLAANQKRIWRRTFVYGLKRDREDLKIALQDRYSGEAMLCKNGRSALALALKAYFNKGDKIIVNGFTCYAVYEAIKTAGLIPVWADINKDDLNFDIDKLRAALAAARPSDTLRAALAKSSCSAEHIAADAAPKGIIIQNSLGNPVDIVAIEKFAKKHNLIIIEDLAHCAGVRYGDGREVGTVGVSTVLSFGKDKSIDATSGGAVILRHSYKNAIKAPIETPQLADSLRERFYPMFGAICRGLSYVHLGGFLMRGLIKIHWVERSADNKLDLGKRLTNFEAKLALEQLKNSKKSSGPIREFYLVKDRDIVLKKLRQAGYYFDSFWYEKPVSPVRYYKKVNFPEDKCPVATEVSQKIINFPTYYKKSDLSKAQKIVEEYIDGRI